MKRLGSDIHISITTEDIASGEHEINAAIKRALDLSPGEFCLQQHKVVIYIKRKWWQFFLKKYKNYDLIRKDSRTIRLTEEK